MVYYMLIDPTGTGNLFFKFWSIKGELLELYKDTRLFWFYENVASMSADDRGMINKSVDFLLFVYLIFLEF